MDFFHSAVQTDLPLEHFQSDMNKCLLMLLHEGSDIIPDVNNSRDITNCQRAMAGFVALCVHENQNHIQFHWKSQN